MQLTNRQALLDAAALLAEHGRAIREGLIVRGGPRKGKLDATPADRADMARHRMLATRLKAMAGRKR